jgi:hypothetical protein
MLHGSEKAMDLNADANLRCAVWFLRKNEPVKMILVAPSFSATKRAI